MIYALIDGDSLVYDAGKRVEQIVHWDDGVYSWFADLKEGIPMIDAMIREIVKGVGADFAIIALSDYGQTNWRNTVMPDYKGARTKKHGTSRPILWKPLREHLFEDHGAFSLSGCEGDDVLGIWSTTPEYHGVGDTYIVCSIDKDLKSVPGFLVNFHHEGFEVHTITEPQADRFHLYQTLMGDVTDGYPGCPKIGPVTAEKILAPFDLPKGGFDVAGAWGAVVKAYVKAGKTTEDALQNARVARICRHSDYDHEKGEVILWQPPT